MNARNTIMLIGGGGLGPWVWERVTPTLVEGGCQVLAPRLRSGGDDPTGEAPVTLDDWVEDVSTALAGHDDVTVVAHSFAGYVAAAVLERHPRRVRRLVFIDAVLPQPGRSWFEVMGPAVAEFMTGLAPDGAIPWFSQDQLDQLYPGHGITNADFAWMQPHLVPQPIGTYAQPAITKPLNTCTASVAYVRCMKTNPAAADLTDFPGENYRALDAGHWPMITNPAETAQIILELARS